MVESSLCGDVPASSRSMMLPGVLGCGCGAGAQEPRRGGVSVFAEREEAGGPC